MIWITLQSEMTTQVCIPSPRSLAIHLMLILKASAALEVFVQILLVSIFLCLNKSMARLEECTNLYSKWKLSLVLKRGCLSLKPPPKGRSLATQQSISTRPTSAECRYGMELKRGDLVQSRLLNQFLQRNTILLFTKDFHVHYHI